MALKVRHLSPLILAAAAAASIAAAPAAMADNGRNCATVVNSYTCSSPGNVQINAAPQVVATAPMYSYFQNGGVYFFRHP
jgi:hypothetical protein